MTAQNDQDIRLLKENPAQFLVKYQEVIFIIVRAFIKSRTLRESEYDDVVQYVNERLWTRLQRIRETYNGQSLLRTYISVVIRNMVIEHQKEHQLHIVEEPLEYYETQSSKPADQMVRMVIRQELERLDKIMKTFHSSRNKFEFCLKVAYRIPVSYEDYLQVTAGLPPHEQQRLWSKFNINALIVEKDQYRRLSELFNTLEDQNTRTRDSIRKWVRYRLDMVIQLMNGTPRNAHYNDETMQILFERYFSEYTKAEGINSPAETPNMV